MHTENQATSILQQRIKSMPSQLAILGSGWSRVLEGAEIEAEVGFQEWLGVSASVPGHDGKLVIAKLNGHRVAIMAGRLHTYEGYTAEQVTLPIRVLAAAGVTELLVTAACGGLNPEYQVGDFVILNDVMTLFLALDNPLVGPKFLDMSAVFDVELRAKAKAIMTKHQIRFQEGSYCYYHGPNYESPVDKRALHILGADVVGMSTVPEVLVARWLKLKVTGLAFVTNLAFVKHDHKEVLAAAEAASSQMVTVLQEFLTSASEN